MQDAGLRVEGAGFRVRRHMQRMPRHRTNIRSRCAREMRDHLFVRRGTKYRGTSLIKKRHLVEPYSRTIVLV